MKFFLSALFAGLALGNTIPSRCREVKFTVNGSAQNKNLTGVPLTTLDGLVKFFETAPAVTVTGPQTLAGTYCEAKVPSLNNKKLQVFFSSILSNRDSFSALGGTGLGFPAYQPEKYSWIDYANNLGYPTLAIDRLGSGQSSHPDPVVVVQAPYEIALYNNLAEQIRAGSKQLPRAFNYLIYVGNSYGSQLGGGMANSHPDAYNQYLLTGFSYNFQQDFAGVALVGPAPAAVADPARFGTLDPGYVTATVEQNLIGSFFGSKKQVDFDDTVADLFFKRRDVVSVGQFVSIYALTFNAPKYTGKILVLDGEQDQAACGPGNPTLGEAHCGRTLQDTGTILFPAANYNWKSVDRIGHGVTLHTRSQVLFGIAHRWLAGETFKGGPPA